MRRLALANVLLGAAIWASSASAKPETAQELFDRGLADMLAGRFATGCPLIERSHELDAAPGTVFTLAECYARAGRVASAVERYSEFLRQYARMSAAEKAGEHTDRAKLSRQEKIRLLGLVPKIEIRLSEGAPEGTVVTSDGVELGADRIGRPIPIDPGEHVFVARAPGGPPIQQRVIIAPGESRVVELTVVTLASDVDPLVAIDPESDAPDESAGDPSETGGESGIVGAEEKAGIPRWPAYFVGVLGLAGLGVGTGAGSFAIRKRNTELEPNCRERDTQGNFLCVNQVGLDAEPKVRNAATVSTIGFAAGGALVVTSIVLFLVSRPKEKAANGLRPVGSLEPNKAVVGVTGAF